jgi:cellulose synthase/poly-beta-1,6-N-acetylglucosamine synthase-like glycosyltransferase
MNKKYSILIVLGVFLIFGIISCGIYFAWGLTGFLIFISVLLTLQSLFTLRWTLYSWNRFNNDTEFDPPKHLAQPKYSFSILLPVRHEEKVLPDTLKALSKIEYPKDLVEIIILVRQDDIKTIEAAKKAIFQLDTGNMVLKIFNGDIINKPHSLNKGLETATKDVVVIFDAEDEPHPGLFRLINTEMLVKNSDVIQAGVQLIDFNSHWYSILNVLEYYFWFKSGLYYFFNNFGAAPLGGNTVFFKREVLNKIGGWDEYCLAEDADIGIRLSAAGAKISVLYVEKYATKEETPNSLKAFIAQRTRWNQGFLQVLLKGDWLRLKSFKSKLIVFYILISPVLQTFVLIYTPLGIVLAATQRFSVFLTLITYMPFYMVLMQIAVYIYGFFKFMYEYRLGFSLIAPFKIILVYVPYQLVLAYSSFRSIGRMIFGINDWEKTAHQNNHRSLMSEV